MGTTKKSTEARHSTCIGEEGSPGRRGRPLAQDHVFGHGGLGYIAAQQPQLGPDSWGAPERVLPTDALDEQAEFEVNGRPSLPAPRLPAPIKAEALAMPTDDRGRGDNGQGVLPAGPPSRQPDPEQPVPRPQPGPGAPTGAGRPVAVAGLGSRPRVGCVTAGGGRERTRRREGEPCRFIRRN